MSDYCCGSSAPRSSAYDEAARAAASERDNFDLPRSVERQATSVTMGGMPITGFTPTFSADQWAEPLIHADVITGDGSGEVLPSFDGEAEIEVKGPGLESSEDVESLIDDSVKLAASAEPLVHADQAAPTQASSGKNGRKAKRN